MSSQRPGTASSRKAMNTTRLPRRRTATASTSPGVELLDLDPEDAGGADRWTAGPLDPVGDRRPQAGVADPLELAGRAQLGLNLADGQRNSPSGGSRVGQGGTDTSTGLLAQGQFLVAEAGTEQRGEHGRLPGLWAGTTTATDRSGSCLGGPAPDQPRRPSLTASRRLSSCSGDNCQSSAQSGPVGSSQVRLVGVSGEYGLVRSGRAWWNVREKDRTPSLRRSRSIRRWEGRPGTHRKRLPRCRRR